MPSGKLPTYTYRPAYPDGVEPHLRTCSSSRGRLFQGGTYFRSRLPGMTSGRISIQVVEFAAPGDAIPDGVCIVTNYGVNTAEMVTGQAKALILTSALPADESIIIDQLDSNPRARNYRISFKIAPDPTVITDLGDFRFTRPFVYGSKLVAKLTPKVPVFTPFDQIVLQPRYRLYRLVASVADDLITYGWNISDLRSQINASDPWVEMTERGSALDSGGGILINDDRQDHGHDDQFLTPFAEEFLKGADGLPDTPAPEHSGPTRSLVHVNYGELQNGLMAEVNTVYEWVGENASEGTWNPY